MSITRKKKVKKSTARPKGQKTVEVPRPTTDAEQSTAAQEGTVGESTPGFKAGKDI